MQLIKKQNYITDMIHIGEEIQERLRQKRMKVIEFSRRINTNRNNVYDIFNRKSIDTNLLEKISEALEFDFFRLYSVPLSQNKLVQQLPDPMELSKESEELRHTIQKQEKEIAQLSERVKDKEFLIELMRRDIS